MAETTSTTSSPRRRVRATWSATSRMRSGSATDVPPNFCTTRATRSETTDPSQPHPKGSARGLERPHQGEVDDVADVVGLGEEHGEALDARSEARRGRHAVLHRLDELEVERVGLVVV